MKIETILSIIAIVVSVITSAFNIIFETKNRKFRQKVFDYDVQKETTRQLEKRTDDIYTRLNSRSSLIPYFNISLGLSKGIYIKDESKNSIIIDLCLVNVGKESAVNVKLGTYEKGSEDLIKFVTNDKYSTFKFYDLDGDYALSKDKIYLFINKDVSEIDLDNVSDTVYFKIKYKDLLGNTYSQDFMFGYFFSLGDIVFKFDNYTSVPMLIEENIKIE